MTKTEELLNLAEEIIEYQPRLMIAEVNGKDLKQLVELVRMQHEALDKAHEFVPAGYGIERMCIEAITAFEEFDRGS